MDLDGFQRPTPNSAIGGMLLVRASARQRGRSAPHPGQRGMLPPWTPLLVQLI
jgi:hypothetical protein